MLAAAFKDFLPHNVVYCYGCRGGSADYDAVALPECGKCLVGLRTDCQGGALAKGWTQHEGSPQNAGLPFGAGEVEYVL